MENKLVAEVSILINAPADKVWKAITTPEQISKYLFGTKVTSDWKVGSPIIYEGEYRGKTYKDKGTILVFEPNEVFESTYWSSMGGKEDKPENYNKVAYVLSEQDGATKVTLTQDNIASEKEKQHSAENWERALKGLKKVVEGK